MGGIFAGGPLRWLMALLTLLTGSGLTLLAASQPEPPATPTPTPGSDVMRGLAFHPAYLNADGCREVYTARASLKNHGPGVATDVVIWYEIIAGNEWVEEVKVTPSVWGKLGIRKPARFEVRVYVSEDWETADYGSEILVQLSAASDGQTEAATQATLRVVNECGVEPTTSVTPTATVTATATITNGMSGLAYHPAHLNAGGRCRAVYSAQGSLKNHGPGTATDVTVWYEVTAGSEWVDRVEVIPSTWAELSASKPGRFQVLVYVNEDWELAGKGSEIAVQLSAASDVPGQEPMQRAQADQNAQADQDAQANQDAQADQSAKAHQNAQTHPRPKADQGAQTDQGTQISTKSPGLRPGLCYS